MNIGNIGKVRALYEFAYRFQISTSNDISISVKNKVEDTKEVIKSRKSKKDRQYNDKMKKKTKGQTSIYKTLNRKITMNEETTGL